MKKRYLAILLALCMALALFPASAFADTPWWEMLDIESGVEFFIKDGVLIRYNGNGGDVVIPDGVTDIGEDAFDCFESLTSVTIPDSVTSIGDGAFQSCTGLTSVTIPDSVTSIGAYAFYGCTSLTSVIIPDSVDGIGVSTFEHCTSLTSVTIPSSVVWIGRAAFSRCSSLTSVTIPDSVTSIGNGAFSGTPWLESLGELAIANGIFIAYQGPGGDVVIPDGVTSIGAQVFAGCTGLTSVTLPSSVTSIGDYAFGNCTGLTSITIPDSVTSIGDGAFYGCTGLTSIMVSGGNLQYTSIDGVLFSADKSVLVCYPTGKQGSYAIPDGVTSIVDSTFSGCTSLTSVTIPSSVTSIGSSAFSGCTSLTSVTIPADVTSIGVGAFSGTPWLKSLGDFAIVNGILIEYQGSDNDVTIPDSVTSIGVQTFWLYTSLTSVTIPSSVTSIGDDAFYACFKLTSMTIPSSVTSIGSSAFSGCTSLTSVTIPSSVTSIGEKAFHNCTGLTDVYYGGSEAQWNTLGFKVTTYDESVRDSVDITNNVTVHYNSSGPVPTVGGFNDVKATDWYADAVFWAVENNITNGTSNTTFSPDTTCSHVEIITFLYRAAGSPDTNATAPIQVDSWFVDAVNWAYGEGIIDDSFQPDAECTRADTVTYMWKAKGSPAADGGKSFTDVPAGADYLGAVNWAVAQGVTTGAGDGSTFEPGTTCDRAQIVTFLYRAYA